MESSLELKWIPFENLSELSSRLRSSNRRVVTTNGCFDILHVGHVRYLQAAKRLGDILIVGVNSDASVRRLKGPTRPLVSEKDRALVLAALASVDYVTVFGEDTPVAFLEAVRPTTHVKGGDYDPAKLPERAVVEKNGGEVVCVTFVDGYSTTKLVDKILTA